MKQIYKEFLSDSFTPKGDEYVPGNRVNLIEEFEVNNGEYTVSGNARLADYSYLLSLINKLSGRSYALLEASIINKDQLEGLKTSLRGIIDEQRDKAFREMILGE